MQVRYADTPAQKELKRITAERRQYRTNEYNIGAYGTHAVGMNPSIYGSAMWNRRSGPAGYRFVIQTSLLFDDVFANRITLVLCVRLARPVFPAGQTT